MRRDSQTEGGADMTNLRVTFFNFANTPKNQWNKTRQYRGHEIGPLE